MTKPKEKHRDSFSALSESALSSPSYHLGAETSTVRGRREFKDQFCKMFFDAGALTFAIYSNGKSFLDNLPEFSNITCTLIRFLFRNLWF